MHAWSCDLVFVFLSDSATASLPSRPLASSRLEFLTSSSFLLLPLILLLLFSRRLIDLLIKCCCIVKQQTNDIQCVRISILFIDSKLRIVLETVMEITSNVWLHVERKGFTLVSNQSYKHLLCNLNNLIITCSQFN